MHRRASKRSAIFQDVLYRREIGRAFDSKSMSASISRAGTPTDSRRFCPGGLRLRAFFELRRTFLWQGSQGFPFTEVGGLLFDR